MLTFVSMTGVENVAHQVHNRLSRTCRASLKLPTPTCVSQRQAAARHLPLSRCSLVQRCNDLPRGWPILTGPGGLRHGPACRAKGLWALGER